MAIPATIAITTMLATSIDIWLFCAFIVDWCWLINELSWAIVALVLACVQHPSLSVPAAVLLCSEAAACLLAMKISANSAGLSVSREMLSGSVPHYTEQLH